MPVNEKALPRFAFGANWTRFLESLNDAKIATAENSLKSWLNVSTLDGKTFLDIGSGSGLFSLAARRLGATVRSFDFDPNSVKCAVWLREQYFKEDPRWIIEQGSVLDEAFMRSLGTFDVVYAWGVLHHTGAMWQAIAHAANAVASQGQLFIAIYNDQGWKSWVWKTIKRTYNFLPGPLRFLVVLPCLVLLKGLPFLQDLILGHPFRSWKKQTEQRGMSPWSDLIDWVGGYPFEVATAVEILQFLSQRSLTPERFSDYGSSACNEFVFKRTA
ncbi:MAG: hypothetical protein A2992_10030 [Elusimicrobia bacterium RIFCSPLOWO2_01_FULL_59_12]|nr:MAG: hypothetical protein A2992_10030 [Elusimicrobia bacterium RIFCSPLOWO2_01_FULL_59_12]